MKSYGTFTESRGEDGILYFTNGDGEDFYDMRTESRKGKDSIFDQPYYWVLDGSTLVTHGADISKIIPRGTLWGGTKAEARDMVTADTARREQDRQDARAEAARFAGLADRLDEIERRLSEM